MTAHRIAALLHRAALFAYPESFRREFSDELHQVLLERLTRLDAWHAARLTLPKWPTRCSAARRPDFAAATNAGRGHAIPRQKHSGADA